MKKTQTVSAGVAFVLAITFISHIQTTARADQSLINSLDVMTMLDQARTLAESEPVLGQSVPVTATGPTAERPAGTYWSLANTQPPLPFDLFPELPVYAVDPTNGIYLVDDRSVDFPALQTEQAQTGAIVNLTTSLAGADFENVEMGAFAVMYGSNDLWLEITGITNGMAYLNLHNATDEVYEVWSKTDLLASSWNIEQEVWPDTNQTAAPFMVPQLDRTNLFIWARDWTGITSDGNQTPEWWFWKFYHRVDMSDTNLDAVGNPLLYDYTNGIAPAILAITVTNASVVSKPMITVQGYANGPLKNLTFDVNNAAGVVTDQQGYWQAAVYNTNLWQFTTNLFACYDIALASGLNTVVLHATDLGGNMVSTNFSVILDYSADTPPSLTLVWPPDGAAIAGSDFTMQAQTDDNTAVVQATVVDSDGNTNTTGGVVERNGTVWVNHLPLGAGENVVTATVMDAAGNSNSISETVYRSAVTVTMYPLTPDNLNQEWVNVSGTISDPGYEVWINGVQATVNADGNWYIDDDSVQVSPTGTAIFDVSARVASGSGMAIRALAMNGSSSSDDLQQFSQAQPPVVILTSLRWDNHPWGSEDSHEWVYWVRDVGGEDYQWTSGVFYESLLASDYFSDWDQDWIYNNGDPSGYGDTRSEPKITLDTGDGTAGTTRTFLVRMMFVYSYGDPLPPEQFAVNGQSLINTGITNTDYSYESGAVWGGVTVLVPAGTRIKPDITPVGLPSQLSYHFSAQPVDITHIMVVDANRDGQIAFDGSDNTTAANPFRFWINDSKEHGDDESSGGADDQIPGSTSPNYALNHVNGASDLVNFFPVALCLSNLMQWLPPTNGFEYHLVQNHSAVKFVYTSLAPTNAFDYLTNLASYGYGSNLDEMVINADTILVTNAPGAALDTNWLTWVQTNTGTGIILVEGCATTTQPLWLEIWKDGQLLGGVPLYLSISGVEQMFRHLNLSAYGNGTVDTNNPSRAFAPNEPVTNDKNLVFLHGYNVNQQQARGVESEMFKRFYWSGSKAKFYGVTWNGAVSQTYIVGVGDVTTDLQTNVVNALLTASHLKDFLNNLSGDTTVAAHSLGNMVVLSAISDYGATPNHYFMIDSAVAIEAIDGSISPEANMINSQWNDYSNRTFASSWWQLFPTNDARSTLTWQNRLGNLGSVDIYNFYSSGEEVLREQINPTPSFFGFAASEIWQHFLGDGRPVGSYLWALQEKDKGLMEFNDILSSNHGGWRFPANQYGDPNPLPPSTANALSDSTLRQTPIFDFGSYFDSVSGPFPDLTLTNTDGSGSTYAAANRDRILSDAIPALTLPAGANVVSVLGTTHNLNMSSPDGINFSAFQNGWPSARSTSDEAFKWYHSDFDYVAYPFTYKLFNQIVNLGSLK